MYPPKENAESFNVFYKLDDYVVMRDKITQKKFWCPLNMLNTYSTRIGVNRVFWYEFKQDKTI